MMDFRQRLEQNRARPVDSELAGESEEQFACPYFATDRTKSPVCLELRLKGGSRKALPYCYFTEINYDIDTGIEILSSGKSVLIVGRNLAKLFDYLTAYKVRYIQCNIGSDQEEDGLFVKEIIILKNGI